MIGVRYDLVEEEAIYQGADWWHDFQLLAPDTGLPYDLTGCAITAQARKQSSDTAAAIQFACSIPDPSNGVFRLSLTHDVTAAIPKGSYRYDAELSDALGMVSKVITPSTIKVVEEYTKI